MFDMYWDSFENLLKILAVVIILSLIFSICGYTIGSFPRVFWMIL